MNFYPNKSTAVCWYDICSGKATTAHNLLQIDSVAQLCKLSVISCKVSLSLETYLAQAEEPSLGSTNPMTDGGKDKKALASLAVHRRPVMGPFCSRASCMGLAEVISLHLRSTTPLASPASFLFLSTDVDSKSPNRYPEH